MYSLCFLVCTKDPCAKSVKSLDYVTKNDSNCLAIVNILAESVIQMNKLVIS